MKRKKSTGTLRAAIRLEAVAWNSGDPPGTGGSHTWDVVGSGGNSVGTSIGALMNDLGADVLSGEVWEFKVRRVRAHPPRK